MERYALLLKVHVSLSRFLRPLSLLPLCSRHGRSLGARAETAVPNDAEAQEQQREQQEKHMTTPRRLNPPPGKKIITSDETEALTGPQNDNLKLAAAVVRCAKLAYR